VNGAVCQERRMEQHDSARVVANIEVRTPPCGGFASTKPVCLIGAQLD
jgi:hypothetical protein